MSKFLWVHIAAEHDGAPIWHIVRDASDQTHTLCGRFVEQQAWDEARDQLGALRPCDDCTKNAAIHEDAGDQPDIEGVPV